MEKIVPHKKVPLKENVLRLLRLDRGFEGAFSNHDGIVPKKKSFDPFFRVEAYIISNRRKHELEAMKGMMVKESRHDRWKAGGVL